MEALVGRAKLDVRATLGSTTLPASTITQMQEGDTIVLDARLGKPLSLLVGSNTRFVGLPGMVGNRMAIQITDVVEPDPLPALPSSWQPQPMQRRRRNSRAEGAPRAESAPSATSTGDGELPAAVSE